MKLLDLEDERRDAILNAALKEFALRGFDNASTNVIAREAGISKPLMFHYVNNKQDLFLAVYDYFAELLDKEYFKRMDFSERDLFLRLRQSYFLQMELVRQYPWIFEFNKLTAKTKSEEINKEIEKRINNKQLLCSDQVFEGIDESKFRKELDPEKSKEIILWANIGFTNQLLEEIRSTEAERLNYGMIMGKLDDYLGELKTLFYSGER